MNPKACVLAEATQFTHLGGWVVDQQFMDVMGAPFLLAHGLGKPVAPATTEVLIPHAGSYRVWVRTRDWVAPQGPGQFRLHVAGRPLAKVFGCGGDGTWQWWDGGAVELPAGRMPLLLADQTGFEGRCDAILFVKDGAASNPPPNEKVPLQVFRDACAGRPAIPPDAGTFDFVVAGGGYAGLCAAIAAARFGLKVALIQDRPVLGGNASGEVRVNPVGAFESKLYPHISDILKELRQTPRGMDGSGGIRACPDDNYVEGLVTREPGIRLFLDMHVCAIERDGDRLVALRARQTRTGQELRFPAPLFADCTGDAQVGFLAGADWRLGREGQDETGEPLAPRHGDRRQLGVSNYWLADDTEQPTLFPACPWALPINSTEAMDVATPKWPPNFGKHAYAAGWNWETGFDMDQLADGEQVRDHNFRAIYGAWDFLKNKSATRDRYAIAELTWVGYVMGRRESRRLLGDLVLTQQDVCTPRLYPDGCVTATWYFDLHFPHPANSRYFPGQEFRSLAYDDPNFESLRGDIVGNYTEIKPYPIPYRCLYSRNISNLLMAGRNISVTHVALAPVRTMNTTAQMGAVVGRAAFLCRKLNVDPRAIYATHLAEFQALLSQESAGTTRRSQGLK